MDSRMCNRCRQPVLVGLSNGGRAAAVDVVLDAGELNPIGELDALHDGRRTWTVHHSGDVHSRSAIGIGRWPAAQGWRRTVHADHRCEGEQ
jgi:hypothetical protein